ncbi:hypothetical protein B0H14DRAFT_298251 [Mycena olivaceomarginata]|nr:hypothetical protein B0H14DRAFT_298251 [Mycena olivaceomarginata]
MYMITPQRGRDSRYLMACRAGEAFTRRVARVWRHTTLISQSSPRYLHPWRITSSSHYPLPQQPRLPATTLPICCPSLDSLLDASRGACGPIDFVTFSTIAHGLNPISRSLSHYPQPTPTASRDIALLGFDSVTAERARFAVSYDMPADRIASMSTWTRLRSQARRRSATGHPPFGGGLSAPATYLVTLASRQTHRSLLSWIDVSLSFSFTLASSLALVPLATYDRTRYHAAAHLTASPQEEHGATA